MKKTIIISLFLVLLGLGAGWMPAALADTESTIDVTSKLTTIGSHAGYEESSGNRLPEIIGGIIRAFLSIIGIIFMSYMIYAGYLWLTSHGQEEKVDKAKEIIKGAIIGLFVVFAAYAITTFVLGQVMKSTQYNPPAVAQ